MSGLSTINEGAAQIHFEGNAEAFYNPAQEFNRDLTVSVLRAFSKELEGQQTDYAEPAAKKRRTGVGAAPGFTILDALSASGLRALRFAKEVPNVSKIVANDFSIDAVNIIKRNVELNGVADLVTANFGDATQLMSEHRVMDKRFHAVDLDPYGSASPFLNTAVQAVTDGGILMVTSTDMATLCGNTPEASLSKYGSVAFRHKSCHEISHAAIYDRYIEPLLCVSIDFYTRCFVRVHTGARKVKDGTTQISNVLHCTGCHALAFQPLVNKIVNGTSVKFGIPRSSTELCSPTGQCVHCGGTVQMAGPIYTGPYFQREFVANILKEIENTPVERQLGTHKRLIGILSVMLEELDDVPLYYEMDQLVTVCKIRLPKSEQLRSAVLNAGYRCGGSHCNPKALKTDAPVSFLWDMIRTLAKDQKKNSASLPEGSAGRKILEKEPESNVSFILNAASIFKSRTHRLLRFQDNKGRNHGPKAKAKGSVNSAKAAAYNAENDHQMENNSNAENKIIVMENN